MWAETNLFVGVHKLLMSWILFSLCAKFQYNAVDILAQSCLLHRTEVRKFTRPPALFTFSLQYVTLIQIVFAFVKPFDTAVRALFLSQCVFLVGCLLSISLFFICFVFVFAVKVVFPLHNEKCQKLTQYETRGAPSWQRGTS